MFIYTVSDVLGILILLAFIVCFLIVWVCEKIDQRKKRKERGRG